ncbi:MAG: tetratricopeptide repeat protein [Pseudomonadales bacterium]
MLQSFCYCSLLLSCLQVHADDKIGDLLDLWNYGDPAASELLFISLIDEAKASDNSEYLPILITQLARTHSLRSKFTMAHQQLDQAKSLIESVKSRAWIFLLLERGRAYNSEGSKRKAKEYFEEAFRGAEILRDDYLAIDAAHMVAIAESLKNQMKWNVIALGIAETSSSPRARKWLGSLYNNMGWTYFDQGQYVKALSLFESAVVFREAQDDQRRTRIAKWAVARTYRAMDRFDESMSIQEGLLAETEGQGAPADAYVVEELAELYHLKNDVLAPDYFAKAYRLLAKDEWFVENEPERLARLKSMSVKN